MQASTLTDHSSASSECTLGALEEIINRLCAEIRLHQTGVDVHPPWYHHAAISLDHLDATWNNQILPYLPTKDKMHVYTTGWMKVRGVAEM